MSVAQLGDANVARRLDVHDVPTGERNDMTILQNYKYRILAIVLLMVVGIVATGEKAYAPPPWDCSSFEDCRGLDNCWGSGVVFINCAEQYCVPLFGGDPELMDCSFIWY